MKKISLILVLLGLSACSADKYSGLCVAPNGLPLMFENAATSFHGSRVSLKLPEGEVVISLDRCILSR